MRKLVLHPENLTVESFETVSTPGAPGTVRARAESEDGCTHGPFSECVNCNTWVSCWGGVTCFDSCACGAETETCDFYCTVTGGTSCNQPCAYTCNDRSCNVNHTCVNFTCVSPC